MAKIPFAWLVTDYDSADDQIEVIEGTIEVSREGAEFTYVATGNGTVIYDETKHGECPAWLKLLLAPALKTRSTAYQIEVARDTLDEFEEDRRAAFEHVEDLRRMHRAAVL